MKINTVAEICHEANRTLQRGTGEEVSPPWADAPSWQRDSAVDGIQKIASGEVTRYEQSHEGWMRHKLETGWVYGPVKDFDTKQHPCLVPFDDLPEEQQAKDKLFFGIVTALVTPPAVSG